jgi:DNA-directed RNA polymerase
MTETTTTPSPAPGRLTKQLRTKDLERTPDPSLSSREYTPEEIVGAEAWAEMPDDQKRQLAMELDDWLSGMYRARAHNDKALQRGDATDLKPVRRLLNEWTVKLTDIIHADRDKYGTKKGGKRPEWFAACKGIPAEALASTILDALFTELLSTGRDGERRPSIANVSQRLGREVDVMRRVKKWTESEPKLYRSYLKRLGKAGATKRHRRKVMLHGINQKLIPELLKQSKTQDVDALQAWDRFKTVKVGKGLLLLIVVALGSRLVLGTTSKKHAKDQWHKPTNTLELDAETREWISQALRQGEIESRRMRPMVCRPLPWRGPWGGGYLLGTLTSRSVMFGAFGYGRRTWELLKEHPHSANAVYSALNYLGRTPLRVRRSVLSVAVEARDNGLMLPELPTPGRRIEPPPRPADIETNEESRREYRMARARAEEANLKAISKELANEDALAEAWDLRDEPRLYFPHSCDFRGRMYPLPSGLQAQGSDLRRALLEFSDGKPISSEDASAGWLAIQVAKTFGQDKAGFDERIAWVYDNEDLIRAIADDPLGNRQLWERSADKKKLWQCLASCIEWRDFLDHGDGYVSHLPVYVDGTCNGIQHFAALSRAEDLAPLVNLVPGDAPQDLYLAVAERAVARVRIALDIKEADNSRYARGWLKLLESYSIRKLAKKMVMINPYGGTFKSVMDDVHVTLAELDPHAMVFEEEERPRAVGFMAGHLRHALEEQLHGPEAVKRWLMACVEAVHKHGLSGADVKPGVEWFAPSGWPWGQMYGAVTVSNVKATRGDAALTTVYRSMSERVVYLRKQKSACPPNFVHAIDASAMVFALNLLKRSEVQGVIAIHDSVGALAADMPLVDNAVREGFVKVYMEHDPLESFHRAILEQVRPDCRHLVPSPPERGDLDVREVLNSPYFFN